MSSDRWIVILSGVGLGLAMSLGVWFLHLQEVEKEYSLAQASLDWTPVQATVHRTWVDEKIVGTETEASSSTKYFEPKVGYSYEVEDAVYHNENIRIGSSLENTSKEAEEVLGIYPVGPLTAYYNPSQPSQSVLERGVGDDSRGKRVGGFVLVGFGALLALLSLGFGLWADDRYFARKSSRAADPSSFISS